MKYPIRINKYVALAAGLSRREADEYIEQGRVTLNGTVALFGAQVSSTDIVAIDSSEASLQEYAYLLLNKPEGYVCSRKRQGDTPTIYELLPKEFHSLKPVGRLDKDSSGILLLTNDGDFAHRMTHPSFRKIKIYEVQLDTLLQPLHQQMVSDFGITLEDGKSQFLVTKLDESKRLYQVTMHEGRNRQIRRTFSALGYQVQSLHRTQLAHYILGDLEPGKFRFVSS